MDAIGGGLKDLSLQSIDNAEVPSTKPARSRWLFPPTGVKSPVTGTTTTAPRTAVAGAGQQTLTTPSGALASSTVTSPAEGTPAATVDGRSPYSMSMASSSSVTSSSRTTPTLNRRHAISETVPVATLAGDMIRVSNFRDVVSYREELHRKEDDKVIVVRVKSRINLGEIKTGAVLAFKVLRNRKATLEQQFQDEFHMHRDCCASHHPNIAYCYPIMYELTDKSYFAMATDFAEDGSVAHLNPAVQIDVAVAIIRDIASALVHVHAQGLVHCDVKRENVIAHSRQPEDGTERRQVYMLMDFGSARRIGTHHNRSQGGGFTTSHAPPEIFARSHNVEKGNRERSKYVAEASIDVWELGIAALRLYGLRPWKKARAHYNEYRRYNNAFASGVVPNLPVPTDPMPRNLREVVPLMLHPEPEKRCSMADVLKALEGDEIDS